MPRYDPDQIADLAAGRLPREEAEELEREILADPAAAAALAEQRIALSALSSLESAELSETERASLRGAVASSLGLDEDEAVPAARQRRIPWGSVGIAAAALVAVVAVVPVVGLLNSTSDSASTELSADAARTTVAVAESDSGAPAELSPVEPGGGAESTEAAAAEQGEGNDAISPAPTQSNTTTATKSTTTLAASGTTTLERSAEDERAFVEALTAELAQITSNADDLAALSSPAAEESPCWLEDTTARAGELGAGHFYFEHQLAEVATVSYFVVDAEGVPGVIQVYDEGDCSQLTTLP